MVFLILGNIVEIDHFNDCRCTNSRKPRQDNRFNIEHNLSQGKEFPLCVCPCTGRLDNPWPKEEVPKASKGLSLSKTKMLKFVFHLSFHLELVCWPHLSSIVFLSDCCFLVQSYTISRWKSYFWEMLFSSSAVELPDRNVLSSNNNDKTCLNLQAILTQHIWQWKESLYCDVNIRV